MPFLSSGPYFRDLLHNPLPPRAPSTASGRTSTDSAAGLVANAAPQPVRPGAAEARPQLAGDAVLPDPIKRIPDSRPGFYEFGTCFDPPGRQAAQYLGRLAKEERAMRDSFEWGSPEWFRHDRNAAHFDQLPQRLESHPVYDPRREHRKLEEYRASLKDHNLAVRSRQKALAAKVERGQERLFTLVELRWAAENHQKKTGKPAWGRVDHVAGLDDPDQTWKRRRKQPGIDIRGLTREGVENEILAIQAELNRLDRERISPPNLEHTTPLFPKVEFRTREELLARAFGGESG